MYASDPDGVKSTVDLVLVYRSVLLVMRGNLEGSLGPVTHVSVLSSLLLPNDTTRGRPPRVFAPTITCTQETPKVCSQLAI